MPTSGGEAASPRYDISLVIPAYNEARTIRRAIVDAAACLSTLAERWEMVIVNDGSRDATAAEAARGIADVAPRPVRLLEHPVNQGKGAAVRTGVLAAEGRAVAFCDADGATPIAELGPALAALRGGADLVAGSRRIAGASVRRRQPRLRQWCGAIYTRLANWLLVPGVSDVTCGFKALRRAAAQAIFRRMRVPGWSFDAELLFLARRLGYRIVEIPVQWADQPHTKVRVGRDAVRSFQELLAIRWRAWRGGYR